MESAFYGDSRDSEPNAVPSFGRLLLVILALPSGALAADAAQDESFTFGLRGANLYGNGGEVRSLAFSADGKSLAVAAGRRRPAGRSSVLGPGHRRGSGERPAVHALPRL